MSEAQLRSARELANHGLGAQQEALSVVAGLLRDRLPSGHSQITLRAVGITTTYAEFETVFVLPDGRGCIVTGADEPLTAAAAEVRKAMYNSSGGTWFGAAFHYFEAGNMKADFDYDDEPPWTNPPPPSVYKNDLLAFPRDPNAIPTWLAKYLE